MSAKLIIGAAFAAALLLGGYQLGAGNWPFMLAQKPVTARAAAQERAANRKVLYWKDPDGKPDFSPAPKRTGDGRDYLPVYDEEEPALAGTKPAKPNGKG